jgi:hypothetical protein
LLERTKQPCHQCMKDAGVAPKDIGEVWTSTHMWGSCRVHMELSSISIRNGDSLRASGLHFHAALPEWNILRAPKLTEK